MASVENALNMLRRLPRVALNNIKDLREAALARKKKVSRPFHNWINLIFALVSVHLLFICAVFNRKSCQEEKRQISNWELITRALHNACRGLDLASHMVV